ncbi:hypothetical protein EZ449_03095 [Pedobacter frigidisoli]|uniref:Outer membrane protein beta-barrel domain-containing protein n=1 Tax=Pedobacter frigidisoli TaxID=2530455 RepID=A0A4V6N693_9SPHI|nr:hypothetical protein [Pedobacter frigidisoli]TCD12028.1 hypothetical protein EZ449_03095 [Pedobacter frigidisoli]
MKKTLLTAIGFFSFFFSEAQNKTVLQPSVSSSSQTAQPFLFSVNTLTSENQKWNIHYSGSYAEHASGQFGYNGLGQQFGVKGYLGSRFTLYATASVGFANGGGISSAQQAEVIRDLIGGKDAYGFRLGAGLGLSRDWSNVGAAISRITVSFDKQNWRLVGNLRFEKAFDKSRDKLDFISAMGFQHRLSDEWYLGFEAIGQDLEGFWEKDEAEGGAKVMIGPSINLSPNHSKLAFSLSGGPVFYATRSSVIPSEAIREIGSVASGNGYTIRALVNFDLR